MRTKEWGRLTERRVRLSSGLEVDFGFVDPSWTATDPVDPGTASVVLDGCQPMLDRRRGTRGTLSARHVPCPISGVDSSGHAPVAVYIQARPVRHQLNDR